MSSSSIEFGSDNAKKGEKALKAKHLDSLQVVVGSRCQLMIDYDLDEFPQKRFDTAINYLKERIKLFVGKDYSDYSIVYRKYRSKSGIHWHVIIHMPIEMTDTERLLWQQIFGSDFNRDALSAIAISRAVKNPILLFMKIDGQPEETQSINIKEPLPNRKFKNA